MSLGRVQSVSAKIKNPLVQPILDHVTLLERVRSRNFYHIHVHRMHNV